MLTRLGWATTAVIVSFTGPVAAAPDADASAFARSIERAVNARDAEIVNGVTDLQTLVGRATEDLDLSAAQRRQIHEELARSFDFGGTLIAGVGRIGHYKLLKVHDVDGAPRALYRMITFEGGLNYHDLCLSVSEEGEHAIVDAYVYMSGELMSDTLNRTCRRFVGAARKGADHVPPTERMNRLMTAGLFKEAMQLYERLAADEQADKIVQIQRIACASRVSVEALDGASEDFRRRFPDDPCVDLVTLDQLINGGRWDDALLAIDRLRDDVGNDAYLDALSAFIEVWADRPQRAAEAVERALDIEPQLEQAHTARLEVALARGDHDQTARTLDDLEDRFGYVFHDLSTIDVYADFVRSDVYREWMSMRHGYATGKE